MRTGIAKMLRPHHRRQRCGDGALRIRQEIGDTGQGLVRLGIEDMQDGADQQGVRGFLPMIALLQTAFRIHEDVGDVLGIADFPLPTPDFQQRVIGGRGRIGWIEQHDAPEARAKSRRQLPVLALDVMDDR
ncbi:hypothetical protein AA12717_0782 [Gluconacetobacter sacchari DSM 12717]|uniref:Uncharacterized protein n=1 Tax=Gluconacetobacter sacchari DSM 12717 TaxID=1307940 RepID=A0ABQ0P3V7_9PROT|nr:hypothetical protein AA12717_0782 [Gluconacetobacter sacchari DSM 12717]